MSTKQVLTRDHSNLDATMQWINVEDLDMTAQAEPLDTFTKKQNNLIDNRIESWADDYIGQRITDAIEDNQDIVTTNNLVSNIEDEIENLPFATGGQLDELRDELQSEILAERKNKSTELLDKLREELREQLKYDRPQIQFRAELRQLLHELSLEQRMALIVSGFVPPL